MCARIKGSLIGMCLLVVTLFSGCTQNKDTISEEELNIPLSMEEEAYIDYQVPSSKPHIAIDQVGYMSSENKQAIFFGDEVPSSFDVVDKNTGLTVFTGSIEDRGYSEEYDCNISYGDFSELALEGEYFIKADFLGTSYDFCIAKDVYRDIFNEACKSYYYNRCGITLTDDLAGERAHNACHTNASLLREDITTSIDVTGGWHQNSQGSMDVTEASCVLGNLLLAYEIFPQAFTDDTGIPESGNGIPDILDEVRYEIEWLLKMQKSKGDVYSGITVSENKDKVTVSYVEKSSLESTAAFAFCLAKFSYAYQSFDKEYATKCLQAADKSWKYVCKKEKKEELSPEAFDWNLSASFEIYRASGSKASKNYLDSFLSACEFENVNNTRYYGYVTYLNTKKTVEIKYCEKMIKLLMKQGEEISANSRNSIFLVPFDMDQNNNSELLDKMVRLALVDYVIANHEYDNIIENYMHYFLGRNPESLVYLDNVGTNNYINYQNVSGIMKQFNDNSKLIFMMSRLLTISQSNTSSTQ